MKSRYACQPPDGSACGLASSTDGSAYGFASSTDGSAYGLASSTDGSACGLAYPTDGSACGLASSTDGSAYGLANHSKRLKHCPPLFSEAPMALYPTVPICVQLTDYEVEMPYLGVAPVYRTVPPRPPSLYPPLYDVEPPSHGLPEYVALVGIRVNPAHHKNGTILEKDRRFDETANDFQRESSKGRIQQHSVTTSNSKERGAEMITKEVILNQREGKFGLKTGVDEGRVVVTGVSRRGAAGRAGLRPGDQIITINGRALNGLRTSEVQRVFRDCPPVGIKFTFRTRKD